MSSGHPHARARFARSRRAAGIRSTSSDRRRRRGALYAPSGSQSHTQRSSRLGVVARVEARCTHSATTSTPCSGDEESAHAGACTANVQAWERGPRHGVVPSVAAARGQRAINKAQRNSTTGTLHAECCNGHDKYYTRYHTTSVRTVRTVNRRAPPRHPISLAWLLRLCEVRGCARPRAAGSAC